MLCDGYVTEDSGTGVVHQAPYFGEDDNRVCLANGVVVPGGEVVCPLDGAGRFTAPVTDFLGQYVKVGCQQMKIFTDARLHYKKINKKINLFMKFLKIHLKIF